MAFIRRKHINGTDYYALVESYREAGKVRQRLLVSLGAAQHKPSIAEAYAEAQKDLAWWRVRKAWLGQRGIDRATYKLETLRKYHTGADPLPQEQYDIEARKELAGRLEENRAMMQALSCSVKSVR